ncbi:MAG TPA: VWA domain-containing protein [Candidatus Dormibacteraeota bacterium]|nr:VWA domain-containing protein [Candidatus Dormibacteraeota bacterium]
MKSLRKTAIVALATLLIPFLSMNAQEPKPDMPAPTSEAQQQPSAPQQPPPPADTDPAAAANGQARIRIPVNQVIVPVTVKDHSGRLVPDLSKDEFRIFEDKVEQRIAYFSNEAFPLSMVILIDNDLKRKDAEEVAASLRAIVAGISTADEAYVARFDQFFHEGKGFIKDQDRLLTEIKRTELNTEPAVAPPSAPMNEGPVINGHSAIGDSPNVAPTVNIVKGQTTKCLDDAVYSAAQVLKDRGRERRKMIFLISDGANGIRSNTHDYKSTVKELLRYGVSVYSVAVSSAYFERRFSRLVDYAHDSGGDVYFAAKRSTMEELYSRVTEEARNQYTLAYSPTGTNRALDYHSIEVRVKREGLTVDAREGYYAGAAPH